MQVPPIFYKSTNIVLHENHKGICSGQMVPTPKIYGIGSWTNISKLKYYPMFKTIFEFEKNILNVSKTMKSLTRFRVSAHNLETERGRYYDISRSLRICKLCNMHAVESEFHFLLTCLAYRQMRQQFIDSSSWASI